MVTIAQGVGGEHIASERARGSWCWLESREARGQLVAVLAIGKASCAVPCFAGT